MKKLLIIGCARSGTLFTSEALQKQGLDIGHEVMGADGMVSWFATFEDCCILPKEHLPSVSHTSFFILHQVRHPLRVISSAVTLTAKSWRRICARVPEITLEESLLLRCMKYWYYWNQIAEAVASMTYRVETFNGRRAEDVATDTNHREHRELDWVSLHEQYPVLCEKIQRLSTRYGYRESM